MQDVIHLNIDTLRKFLKTRFIGSGERLIYLPEVESTNTLAMQLARERPETGLVVLADSQTAGKGRQGRRWVDTPGCNVLSSMLLRPLFPPYLLVMMASLAVVEAIEQVCGVPATIKWPNDVLIGERKVCGILIETTHNSAGDLLAVLGIGINVNGSPRGQVEQKGVEVELAAIATTLESACGHLVSREAVLAHVLTALEKEYTALQEEAIRPPVVASRGESAAGQLCDRWRNRLSTIGRALKVQQGDRVVEGVAEGVNDRGELLLRRHSGELMCISWGVVEQSAFPD